MSKVQQARSNPKTGGQNDEQIQQLAGLVGIIFHSKHKPYVLQISTTSDFDRKKTNLFVILCGIVLTNAIVAEVIGVKIFAVAKVPGFPDAPLPLFSTFNMTAGVVLWPVVFIISDIINEYFGTAGVRKISIMTAVFIAYTFLALYVTTLLTPSQDWLNYNKTDPKGHPIDFDAAFNMVFKQGLNIIFGSLAAFLIGQLLDAQIFQLIRKVTGHKFLWLRATGSTLVSQLIDTYVVQIIAFYFFGNWSLQKVLTLGFNSYLFKFVVAIAVTPLLYLIHNLVDNYLGKATAEKMIEEAALISEENK